MARQVRCHDTGLLADKEVSFKAADGKYYSSEAAFNNIREEQEWRNKTYELLIEICKFKNDYVPPVYKRELKSYADFGFENIYLGLRYARNNIEWVLETKDFKSEYAEARYISTIIRNNAEKVAERRKKDEQIKKQQDKLIQQDEIPVDTNLTYKDKSIIDISSYLEGDD